ncbi:class I SAM-dependent methyltransferase [Amycolatopsis vastitatis]|uniref:class I SAM-dependent methyltransferase n=1 Tax=Amycolatopsis vastitatis TaxID=1905142 RepID=UPI001F0ADB63|nr:class I SAM-dependent methyltransferase [Amycolatopsis vastitatis]
MRTRWFDDAVTAASAAGVGQLVELGSGLDTRPYRLGPVDVGARFVPEDLPSLLRACGWIEREHTTIAGPARAYGRMPNRPTPGETPAGYTYLLAVADRRRS